MNLTKITVLERFAIWVKENPTPPRILGAFFFIQTAICGLIWLAGKDVESVAFVLSLCSTFFFALPAIADVIVNTKTISEMNFEEILDYVSMSDPVNDWKNISVDERDEFFCLHDTRLRIRHNTGKDGIQNDDFQEDWANKFPDPKATGLWYDLILDGEPIKRFLIVTVDGFRAYIPLPKRQEMTITPLQDKIGQIISMQDKLYQDYKNRIGIKIHAT